MPTPCYWFVHNKDERSRVGGQPLCGETGAGGGETVSRVGEEKPAFDLSFAWKFLLLLNRS
jgi:hypothetical protein